MHACRLSIAALCALSFACTAPTAIDMRAMPPLPQASTLPEGWQHGAFMEIFVRASTRTVTVTASATCAA